MAKDELQNLNAGIIAGATWIVWCAEHLDTPGDAYRLVLRFRSSLPLVIHVYRPAIRGGERGAPESIVTHSHFGISRIAELLGFPLIAQEIEIDAKLGQFVSITYRCVPNNDTLPELMGLLAAPLQEL